MNFIVPQSTSNGNNMNFDSILVEIQLGKKVRRTNWSWDPSAYLKSEPFYGVESLYMFNSCPHRKQLVELYGLTLLDITSDTWEVVI